MRDRFVSACLVALAACASGCASAPEPVRQRSTGALLVVELRPPEGHGVAQVEPVWRDLWAGFAADATTRGLLARLYGDLPTIVEVWPADGSELAPPPPGTTLALRVRDETPPVVRPGVDGCIEARRDRVEVVLVGPPGLSLEVVTSPTDGAPAEAFGEAMAVHTVALRLAVDEYLTRALGAGWSLASEEPIDARVDAHRARFRWSVGARE